MSLWEQITCIVYFRLFLAYGGFFYVPVYFWERYASVMADILAQFQR
jgi:hypothetical protein